MIDVPLSHPNAIRLMDWLRREGTEDNAWLREMADEIEAALRGEEPPRRIPTGSSGEIRKAP